MAGPSPNLEGIARQREYAAANAEIERARVADQNRLAVLLLLAAGGAGVFGLRWIIRRRDTIAAGAVSKLATVEATRRKAAKALQGMVETVRSEADKRG